MRLHHMEVFILWLGMKLNIGLADGGLETHLIVASCEGVHCMKQQAIILKKMTIIKTINASQRSLILGSQKVSLDNKYQRIPLSVLYLLALLYAL